MHVLSQDFEVLKYQTLNNFSHKYINQTHLLHCCGFTEIRDIIKLISHSLENTVKNAKYTVNMIQSFIKPNIKSFYFFKTF